MSQKINLYSLEDHVADYCHAPFPADNDAVAIRVIQQQMLESPISPLFTHSDNFNLFLIGSFEKLTGQLFINDSGRRKVIGVAEIKEMLQTSFEERSETKTDE